jgi:hypothetical protein
VLAGLPVSLAIFALADQTAALLARRPGPGGGARRLSLADRP